MSDDMKTEAPREGDAMGAERLFRQEALDAHARPFDREGAVLRIVPAWTSAAYWLVTAVAGAGLLFFALARVPRYAEGPAVVRIAAEGPREVATPGQAILPGEAPGTITRRDERPELLAFVPDHHRQALLPGMTIRLELDGWPRTWQEATVESVSEPVLGPAEARRLLGPAPGDSVSLSGPVVLLRARLPAPGFRAGKRTVVYHDGMLGRAAVRLESERLLFLLVPALESALGN